MSIASKPDRGILITGLLFAAAALLVVVSVGAMYVIGKVALDSNRHLATQREIIGQLEMTASLIKDAETGQRGYLLTGDETYLQPYTDAESQASHRLKVLQQLATAGELPALSVEEVRHLIEEKFSELKQTIELHRVGNQTAALALVRSDRGRQLMKEIRLNLSNLQAKELAEFQVANRRAERATKQRNAAFIGTGCLNLAFLSWAFSRMAREIRFRQLAERELLKSHAELETRVKERTTALEAANRELEAFGYSVSHDLRAPLRHVSSYIKLLDKSAAGRLDQQSQRYVRVIAEAAQRMSQLIEDLLVLSRIGRATLAESTVNLESLVDEARQELASEEGARPVEWRIGSLPKVRGDPGLLRSAMVNLLSNALKYTRPRNPAVIEIGSKAEDGEVICFVKDNGAGFDMKFIDKLFGVFQRLHDRGEFEGTGIGLASVRRIIQRHGGRTWAEGEVDRGATFYFSLPRGRIV